MTTREVSDRVGQATIYDIKPGVAVLTSWKEIAQYIGKGVRTVQRWEQEFGLPVRRPKHATKSTVLAVPSELNEWVHAQKFPDGRTDIAKTDRSEMMRRIQGLQAEVSDLRRQLQLAIGKPA